MCWEHKAFQVTATSVDGSTCSLSHKLSQTNKILRVLGKNSKDTSEGDLDFFFIFYHSCFFYSTCKGSVSLNLYPTMH